MAGQTTPLETARLTLRRFTAEDWAQLKLLALDKERSPGGKYDHAWPTEDGGCRAMAEHLAGDAQFRAVCRRDDGSLIGLLVLSHEAEPGVLEVGHLFHAGAADGSLDVEALGCLLDYAFEEPGTRRVVARNAEAWETQVAPLRKLGFRVVSRGDGTDFFQRDAAGQPISFVACTMALTREEWLALRESRRGEG